MPDSPTLHISPLGLSEADFAMLQAAVGRLINEDGMPCRLLAPNDPQGHLTVIDHESMEGQAILPRLRPGQVKLLFAASASNGKNLIALQKPIQAETLLAILRRICQQMLKQLGCTQQASPASQTPPAAETRSEPPASATDSSGLLTLLMRAKQQRLLLHIKWDDQELFVDGQQQVYATLASQEKIAALLAAPADTIQVAELEDATLPARLGSVITGLENLLWEAGLACDSGLPADFEPGSSLRLKAWPNFTRNGFHPEHFKIAALLAQRAASYEDLLQQPGMTAAAVCSFINACHAVDLIIDAAQVSAPAVERAPRSTKRKGILNRIAQRLGIASA